MQQKETLEQSKSEVLPEAPKKEWVSPELRSFGGVAAMTLNNSGIFQFPTS